MVNIAASAQMMMLWDAERLWRRYHAERGNDQTAMRDNEFLFHLLNFENIYSINTLPENNNPKDHGDA
ncbi:hypothetical protein [Pseudomonas sp. R2-60-08W]|uniref:hypothetical protein n=1 Tax=Pseudomonas sp. R2-60-08W TaxID=1173280 RepID=UPI000F55D5CB|nr:hypothetical protein [Pseudomonas sp. R2-60-08W]AZF26653.1 hypothetical protein C4J90_2480 [Pseudomonas sp. R2-60-08W]